jgi:plasmid stabilization system protein ParE
VKRVVLSREAEQELTEDAAVYEDQRVGRGKRFAIAVRAALRMIAKHPKAATPYREVYRRKVVSRFPYVVFYREYDDRIWVAAIYNTRREPDGWLNREPEE